MYHRILKIVTGKKNGYVPDLRPAAQKLHPAWQSGKLDLVHKQVNDLKHKPRGVHDTRIVKYADAVAAAGELLDLVEAWSARAPAAKKP